METEDEVGELVREFLEEYLPKKRKERMLRYKKAPPEAPEEASGDEGDGPGESLSEECRAGMCEHPEHATDDELDDL